MSFPSIIYLPDSGLGPTEGVLFSNSGDAVAGVGDVNGDGYDDVTTTNFNDHQGAGIISVIFGGDGNFPTNPEVLDGTNGFYIVGATLGSHVGYSICSVDINNDGTPDIIIGAPEDGEYGKIYVVLGNKNGFPVEVDLATLTPETGFTMSGDAQSGKIGEAISNAGDFNMDGNPDLVVATPHSQIQILGKVIYGSQDISSGVDFTNLDGTLGFSILGEKQYFITPSFAVANFGKISSTISGGILLSYGNYAYVIGNIAGYKESELNVETLDGNNGFKFNAGPSSNAKISAVSNAGDFNGNWKDIAIGISTGDGGSVAVLYGQEGAFNSTVNYAEMDASDGVKITSENDRLLGYSIANIGSIGQGTTGGLLIGSPGDATAYVVLNQADFNQDSLKVEDLNGQNGFAIKSPDSNSRFASSLSGAGKFNNNYGSIVINQPGVSNYPEAYILYDFTHSHGPSPSPTPGSGSGSGYLKPTAIGGAVILGILGIGYAYYHFKHGGCKRTDDVHPRYTDFNTEKLPESGYNPFEDLTQQQIERGLAATNLAF